MYKKHLIHHTGMPFFCVWFGSVVAQIQLAFVAQGSIQLLRHKPHLAAAAAAAAGLAMTSQPQPSRLA